MAIVDTSTNAFKPPVPSATFDVLVRRVINRIAECDVPFLILGEEGTGKRSLVAEVHDFSHRTRGPYVELTSRELDASSLLSVLSTRGTFYLSDVTDLTLALQEMLIARYLLRGDPPLCRLIFGASHDPLEEVRALRMREDFFYLVSAVTFRLPPLRSRKQEIVAMAETLLAQYAKQFDRPQPELCPEIVQFLLDHSWPGNIPELQRAMKTLVIIGDQRISLAALRAAIPVNGRLNGHRKYVSLKEAARHASSKVEREMISDVLSSNGGNRKRAASELGISYKALLYKIKQIGTDPSGAAQKTQGMQP